MPIKRLTIEIDEELKRALKVKAAQKGITLTEHVEVLLEKDLDASRE